MQAPRSRWLAAVLVALLGACRSAPKVDEVALGLALPRAPVLTLPGDWRTLAPEAFARWVLEAFPEDHSTPLPQEDLRELQRALDEVGGAGNDASTGGSDSVAVRAAVILGRSRYPSSAGILIRRLEKRVLGPGQASDSGDVVAAQALATFPNPRRYAQRMVPLAVGSRPHPDLEVRVECAATALRAGYTEGIPFLLQVLRIDTYAGLEDVRDFPVSPDTVWARWRAAEALSSYAGVSVTYRPEGSIAHREKEAARLEALLAPLPPAR